jgi:universal stress protein A
MCPFSHILLLLDCSLVDHAIIPKIIDMSRCGNARVTLAHVVHSHTIDQDRALKTKADRFLEPVLKQFRDAGINAEKLLLSGEPEKELVKEIGEGDYDLVAMATHGHKTFSDILFGSVSDYLKHETDVPLLMVRGK